MSGIQLTTEIDKNAISVAAIIKQIKESQQSVLKAFEDHNNLVNKSLEIIQQLKTETKVEVVKVKDPLEEIKTLNDIIDKDVYNHTYTICGVLINIFLNILSLYGKDKISSSFKVIFLNIFKKCLEDNNPENINEISSHFKEVIKKEFLKVRDIRWLLLEMEKYPQYFKFTEDDLTIMKENGASRDNIYLVKKFLKKDGDYEEMYEEEDGGGIKCRYHMTGGQLNGEYKQFYKDGKNEFETKYTNGVQDNSWKAWYNNGQQFVEGKITGENIQWYKNGNIMNKYYRVNDKKEGEYKEWHENGSLSIIANHKDDKVYGDYESYHPNGKLYKKMFCLDGDIKKNIFNLHGKYTEYKEDGTLERECEYKDGKLEGEYKEYYPNGSKKATRNYKDGQPSGITETWYENGICSVYAEYNKGLMSGVYNAWYENGNPLYETNHLYNKRHGVRKDYYPNGQLSMIKNYINGVQVGEYKHWYEDGKISLDVIYRDDGILIKSEHWNQSGILTSKKSLIENDTYELTRYYECDGKLHDQVIMVGGKWNGEYNSWWHNGNKCIETTYKDDKIHGDYLYWNEDGTLKEKSVYENGFKV